MKRKIISFSLIIMMIAGLFMLTGCNKKYEKYYKTTYSSTYNSIGILKGKSYEIVTNKTRLNEIFSVVSNKEYEKIFDEKYFENKRILVVEGGIDSKIEEININKGKADVKIYYGSPLVSNDEKLEFDLYLIPIEEDVIEVDVELEEYPDRIY